MKEKELNRLRRRAWLRRGRWMVTFTLTMGTSTKMLSPFERAAWHLLEESPEDLGFVRDGDRWVWP